MNRPRLPQRAFSLTLIPAIALVALSCAASAGPNLVLNGNFEQTSQPGSAEFGLRYPSQQVTDWNTYGYNFVFQPGTADSSGAAGEYGNLKLWGPANGSNNGLTASSPAGGSFIAADGAYAVGPIAQTIDGLTPGAPTTVAFYWAAAQQAGYTSPTTEQWQVQLGSETQLTPIAQNVSHGFTGWTREALTFTPTSTSEVLSFLSLGTPAGVPPFALLDGVSASTSVPEPAAWSVFAVGVAGLLGVAWRRRRPAGAASLGCSSDPRDA